MNDQAVCLIPESSMLEDLLTRIGYFKIYENISSLKQIAGDIAINAGTEGNCALFPSYIPAKSASKKQETVLVIDIGGTSTKACLRLCRDGETEWRFMFEYSNEDFEDSSIDARSIDRFFITLASRVSDYFKQSDVSGSNLSACALVWSNAIENQVVENGVTALVANIDLYRKGEWFNADLRNGDDLGEAFAKAMAKFGLPVDEILVANDTPLTMKAAENADAGMVASTGLNATLVTGRSAIICNGEVGGRFSVPNEFLSDADNVDEGLRAGTVEMLSSGAFLPRLFVSYVDLLAKNGCDEITDLAETLNSMGEDKWEVFDSRDMFFMMEDRNRFQLKHGDLGISEQALDVIAELSSLLYQRGALMASLVAYASIYRQLEEKDNFIIALDSSLSRKVPVFWETFKQSLEGLMPEGKVAELELIRRVDLGEGRLSVPMIGAANAVDSVFS